MVINIDDELLFQIDEAGSIDIRTFDNENGVVRTIDRWRYADRLGARKLLVGMRRRITHDGLDVFVERAQQPIQT